MGFSSMPTGAKVGAAAVGGGAIVGALYPMMRFLPATIFFYIVLGTAMVGALTAIFGVLVKRSRSRKAKPMEKSLRDNSSVTPQGVAEPGRRARLDDLRKNFDDGVEKFRAAGKNIYSLPWYALVGEAGSGKTEAIRHCNVGFPPGLQDQLQGVGGTINMNWWFTNHAVILDTAGRLMFEEVEPGGTSEWREFLKLLRANRPNCPMNGMLLCIPADSLIKDTADELERKGAKIAQQLDQIQRALGVRFPVFVVITKCDLVNGFREFFEDIKDPQLQHQMMGWSNPDPLDEAFRPELVSDHLRTVVDRLLRRRLGLLLDPINTEDGSARRTDQVDALYAFPQALTSIAPRLRRYLEMIFVAGEWSAKPLFLRGIYFTSSMREGSALDAELAEVLGVPVESLPEGKVWERDRAYFLRDLFMNKVFKEKGLVTNATNAKRRQRRRKAVVLLTSFLAVLGLAFFTWWGFNSFRKSIGAEADYWWVGSLEEFWPERDFGFPVVFPQLRGSTDFDYTGKSRLVDNAREEHKAQITGVGLGSTTFAQFHCERGNLVQKDIHIPWVFRFAAVFGEGINARRREAHRVLLEAGVLRPLVDAARRKMLKPGAKWSAAATTALAKLVELEAASMRPSGARPLDPNSLFRYVLQSEKDFELYRDRDASKLKGVLASTYSLGESVWPPASLFAGSKFAVAAVDKGVGDFIEFWKMGGGIEASEILDAIAVLKGALGRFGAVEADLLAVDDRYADKPGQPDTAEVLDKTAGEWKKRLGAVRQEAGKIEAAVTTAKLGLRTLVETYDTTISERLERAEQPHRTLISAARPKAPATGVAPDDDKVETPGVKAVREHIEAVAARVEKSLTTLEEQYKKSKDRQELLVLDPRYLLVVPVKDDDLRKQLKKENLRLFELRRHMYDAGDAELAKQGTVPAMAGLAPAVATVVDDSRRGAMRVDDLTALQAEAFRTADAAAVSKFVINRLAKSRRVFTLVKGVLEIAPKSAKDVASKVTQTAKDRKLPAIPRPHIPGTSFRKGQTFPAQFHPDAAAATFAGWKTIAQYVQPSAEPPKAAEGTDIIDRPVLAKLYQTRQKAYDDYLKQYQEYWIKGVLADLTYAPADPNWGSFQADLIGMQVRNVTIDLEKLGRTILKSLDKVKAVLPAGSMASYNQTAQELGADLEKFQSGAYIGIWRAWLRRWKDLGADPYTARKTILPKTPSQFIDDYLPFSSGVDTLISEKYWKELAHTGLDLLAKRINIDVEKAFDDLDRKYSRFPLVAPKAGAKELTPAEAGAARLAVAKILGEAKVFSQKNIGGGARTKRFEVIDRQLDRLCGLGLNPQKRAKCVKMKNVLAALPAAGDKLTCTVRMLPVKQQEEYCGGSPMVVRTWTVLQIDQDGAQKGIRLISQGQVKDVGKVELPGGKLTFKFYRYPADVQKKAIDRTHSVAGTWATMQLLHSPKAKRVGTNGTKWHVEVVIKDTESRDRSLWLELEFPKPVPKISEWP